MRTKADKYGYQVTFQFDDPTPPKEPNYDAPNFDGLNENAQNEPRLKKGLKTVFEHLQNYPGWNSVEFIVLKTGAKTYTGTSAFCRDLRKMKFGSFRVDGKKVKGCYRYRLIIGSFDPDRDNKING